MSPIHPEVALELSRQRTDELIAMRRSQRSRRPRRVRTRWVLVAPRLTRARA
jgi:hypothetical protein